MQNEASTSTRRQMTDSHPYLTGNFAPISRESPLTRCTYEGTIPACLAGGQYVRNGGNPLKNDDLARDAHWFDGDGMLSGVLFRRIGNSIQPEFVNAYVLTDVYLNALDTKLTTYPILPSIASLLNPLTGLFSSLYLILRTLLLVFVSHLPGTSHKIKRISVANTGVLWHDGRALATCESGPPMRILLPGLNSVGWYNGNFAEGEPVTERAADFGIYGDHGVLGWMKEWSTAHPRVDPTTKELISFHNSFLPPFVRYSIVPANKQKQDKVHSLLLKDRVRIHNRTVPGITSAKMMHDFGVSEKHTVILDLPLSLDPLSTVMGKQIVAFDARAPSRFGIFPRYSPEVIQWFEEKEACCIFHTANTYDDPDPLSSGQDCVKMLSCRLNSARLVFSAGNLPAPASALASGGEPDACCLHYHSFCLGNGQKNGSILHSFPLSAVPFEFPAISPSRSMRFVRYVYGCSLSVGSFSAALGRAAKIDCLVKMDVKKLLMSARGRELDIRTPCDNRTVPEILATSIQNDSIKILKLPDGYYAQEMAFVSCCQSADSLPEDTSSKEDDGYLLTYVFNENAGIDPITGSARADAKSEFWVINAKNMQDVVCKIHLPQRVPYGLHGTFFSEAQVQGQREVEMLRNRYFTQPSEPAQRWRKAVALNEKSWWQLIVGMVSSRLSNVLQSLP